MTDVDAVMARVLSDLDADRTHRVAVNRTDVEVEGLSLGVVVATRGRMLLRITDTTFVVPGPPWEPPDLVIDVGHRGAVRRAGVRVRAVAGGDRAAELADHLSSDTTLAAAVLPLDSTSLRISVVDGHLQAAITLMGASMTRMRVPPTATYVRLHDDQRIALLATARALQACWAPV